MVLDNYNVGCVFLVGGSSWNNLSEKHLLMINFDYNDIIHVPFDFDICIIISSI